MNAEAETAAFEVVANLRRNHVRAEMAFKGNIKKRLQRANVQGVDAVVFVEAERWSRGELELKQLASGEQSLVTDDPESGMDIFDVIRALTFSNKIGARPDRVSVGGKRLGIIGNMTAADE